MKQVIIGALGATLLTLGLSGIAGSDRWRGDEDHDEQDSVAMSAPRDGLTTAAEGRYQAECGGCHLAYPPGLLPAAAWERVMATLPDHFGDDASLDPATTADLLGYLSTRAANPSPWVAAGAAAPIATGEKAPRITRTRGFLQEHSEVPVGLVRANAQIGRFGNCHACHRGAAAGRFDEDEVAIPGIGPWDD
jgi:mono/diheme cytochrome c family protein